jgi:TRAP-type mannitol/chloroaromatic compound transport system substrate-binding protein
MASCRLTNTPSYKENVEQIELRLGSSFPMLQNRQLLSHDELFITDITTMLEGHFYVERRKADKLKSFAQFEGSMLLGGSVYLCEIGRVAGETEHASPKVR